MKWVKFKLGVKLTRIKWELCELGTTLCYEMGTNISISLIIDVLLNWVLAVS